MLAMSFPELGPKGVFKPRWRGRLAVNVGQEVTDQIIGKQDLVQEKTKDTWRAEHQAMCLPAAGWNLAEGAASVSFEF